jgi:predicted phosphohydrolase
MMRLAWCTDIHLNFLEDEGVGRFCETILAHEPDAVVITGDISEAPALEGHLLALADALKLPIYFVLGNHDFYRGSIKSVRAAMRSLVAKRPELSWMPAAGVVPLGKDAALVGHDGWYDGRFGDFARSRVMLNDYLHIDELAYLPKAERLARIQALADEAATHFTETLPGALDRFAHVVIATHVPPFKEACWHEGRISDDQWLPHFSSRAVGEALLAAMRDRADRKMTVLCGHTHGRGTIEPLPNMIVHTGGAEYGAPEVQLVLEV